MSGERGKSKLGAKEAKHLVLQSEFRVLTPHQRAVKLVDDHGATLRTAAQACHLSKSAVGRALSARKGNRTPGVDGRPNLLNKGELEELFEAIEEGWRQGTPCSTSWTISKVNEMRFIKECSDSGQAEEILRKRDDPDSDGHERSALKEDSQIDALWVRNLRKVYPDRIKFSLPRYLEPERAGVQVRDLEDFYQLLRKTVKDKDIDPRLMANADETMLLEGKKRIKVLIPAECGRPIVSEEKPRMHITLLACVFASGDFEIPLAIINTQHVPVDLPPDVVGSLHWRHQPSGWITSQILLDWFNQVFLPRVEERRRQFQLTDRWALLLVDGHASRANPELLRMAMENKIEILTYVAHASHLQQVLDCGIFRQFKSILSSKRLKAPPASAAEWRKEILVKTIGAIHTACAPHFIRAAWRDSGRWPIDSEAVINQTNFPGFGQSASSEPERRRKRAGFRISHRILTCNEAIEELEAPQQV